MGGDERKVTHALTLHSVFLVCLATGWQNVEISQVTLVGIIMAPVTSCNISMRQCDCFDTSSGEIVNVCAAFFTTAWKLGH